MKNALNLSFLLFNLTVFGQTSDCDNTTAGQITPKSTCQMQAMNSSNNTDYWNAAGTNGSCNETDRDDVWMWFTATGNTATVTYDATTTTEDPILTIFSGACSTTMTPLTCSNSTGNGGIETVTFPTTIGQTLRIRVQARNSDNTMNGTACVQNSTVVTTPTGTPVTAPDCNVAIPVCTDINFHIDPNGNGAVDELPYETTCNPTVNPTDPIFGTCMSSGEMEPTWLLVTISTSGKLEFIFGGNNTQAGFYDWGMWAYNSNTCNNLSAAICSQAPVRCNWNGDNKGGTGLMDIEPPGGYVGNYEPGLNVTAGQQYVICFSNYSGAVTSVPLQFMTGPGNAGVQCPVKLPTIFETFEAEMTNPEAVKIDWTMSGGITSNKMELQKSQNGLDWTLIQNYGTISLQKASSFHYVDEVLRPGTSYYRVSLTDPNGIVQYSEIEAVYYMSEKLNVYPNPATNSITLTSNDLSNYSFRILDVYGRDQHILFDVTDSQAVTVNTSSLRKGIYFLQYGSSQNEYEIIKIEIIK